VKKKWKTSMSNPHEPPHYHVYLLRCWTEHCQDPTRPAIWRFSLEDPAINQRYGFATMDALMAFLHDTLSQRPYILPEQAANTDTCPTDSVPDQTSDP
jgi:hypothetical protein